MDPSTPGPTMLLLLVLLPLAHADLILPDEPPQPEEPVSEPAPKGCGSTAATFAAISALYLLGRQGAARALQSA